MYTLPCYIDGLNVGVMDYMHLAQQIASSLWAYMQPEQEQQTRNLATAGKNSTKHLRSSTVGSAEQRKKNGRQVIYKRKRGTLRTTQWLRDHGGAARCRAQLEARRTAGPPASSPGGNGELNGLQGDGPHVGGGSN